MHLRDYVETKLLEYVLDFQQEQRQNRAIARKLGRKRFPMLLPEPTIAQLNFERERLVKEYSQLTSLKEGDAPLEPLNY